MLTMRGIMKLGIIVAVIGAALLEAQTAPTVKEQWNALRFLEGTWEAATQGGAAKAVASGTYTFRKELGGHVLARHTSAAGCKGPADFNCDHGDLLYIYPEGEGPLKAIYFDNEGHVIHYSVTTPTPTSAVFVSDGSTPGPRFRLVYELKNGIMSGKFQTQMPGKAEWTSYLEWSGRKL
jgi:hypothetical protein